VSNVKDHEPTSCTFLIPLENTTNRSKVVVQSTYVPSEQTCNLVTMDPTASYVHPPYEVRTPIFSFISDKHLSLALPIIVYWVYSLFFHILDMQSWSFLEKYRLHTPEEVLQRNRVTRWDVVIAVLVQQVGQTIVGAIVLRTEADEGIPHHALAISKLQSPPWNLPNLASAEVVYWGLLPVLRQVMAIFVLDAWEYWIHRLMHVNKFLYRHLHSRHHRLYVPYAFGALYNHPLEGLILDTVGSAIAMKVAGLTLREAMFFFSFATMKTGIFIPIAMTDF
jgi:sphinganine C4-monooxygenase